MKHTTWTLPPTSIFARSAPRALPDPHDETARAIELCLASAGYPCTTTRVTHGPSTTRLELELWPDSRPLRLLPLAARDLQYALGVESVRVLAPVPGKRAIGIEIPAAHRRPVLLGDVVDETEEPMTVPFGVDVNGSTVQVDLASLPHALIAGTTGSGKSSLLHAIICALLSRSDPDQLALLLVDPKRVEFEFYRDLPHLIAPVASEPEITCAYLEGLIDMMQGRYMLMERLGARSLPECNRLLAERDLDPLAYVLVVADEIADLMMSSRKVAEPLLVRLAQKGRACGVHLLLATQSPRVNVTTGLLKVNIPSRVALSVPSAVDSRVILDQDGAETLLGRGDLLLSESGLPPMRLQAPFVSGEEITELCDWWRKSAQSEPVREMVAT